MTIILAGLLYLAGDNIAHIFPFNAAVCETCTELVADIGGDLVAFSLILSTIPPVAKKFQQNLLDNTSQPKSKPPELLETLYQLLVYTVYIDQLYTIILSNVTLGLDEFDTEPLCPYGFVVAGIVAFVVVSVFWIGVVSSLLMIYLVRDLKCAVPSDKEHKVGGTILFLLIAIFYTPAYIALDNRWPWVCIAKCHLNRECEKVNSVELCNYESQRLTYLLILSAFTLILILAYIGIHYRCHSSSRSVRNASGQNSEKA